MIYESPSMYERVVRPYMDSVPESSIQWVYNCLDKRAEVESIVWEDPDPVHGFIVLPDMYVRG